MKLPPERPTVTVPRRRSRLDAEGLEIHWADLTPQQVSHGVTTKVRTVIDCARAYRSTWPSRWRTRRCGTAYAARSCWPLMASPRTGRGKALRVVRAADGRAANPFESVLRAIADDVPGLCVVPQQSVGDGYVDLLDHRLRLVIEADWFRWHSTRRAWARDVRRYTCFARLGYTVVRFTWGEVMYEPHYVRAVLLDVVAMGPPARAVRRRTA